MNPKVKGKPRPASGMAAQHKGSQENLNAMTAAERKRKSRANQTEQEAAQERDSSKKRMSSNRDKKKVETIRQDNKPIKAFLPQRILDDVANKVLLLEHDIISLLNEKEKEEWSTFWEDPAFESMLSHKVNKVLPTMMPCASGDSSLALGRDFPELQYMCVEDIFVSYEEKMNKDIASFKRMCPEEFLHIFELKVAAFEKSLLISVCIMVSGGKWGSQLAPEASDDEQPSKGQDEWVDLSNEVFKNFSWE